MNIVFYVAATIALISTILAITGKNAIHALLYLIISLLAVSVIFYILGAPFIAALEVIIYAGAIMVLFLFVVMLMNLNAETEPIKNYRLRLIGILSGGSLLLVLIAAMMKIDVAQPVLMSTGDSGLIKVLGHALFTNYVLPFEISSVLFLSAMIGAVIIGKKE